MEGFDKANAFGPYQLHAKIGQGGVADLFLGTSQKPGDKGQVLAIKKLLPHLNSNKSFVDMLIHEAKLGVLLHHPGIANVLDLGSYRSEFFIAMEYIHGKSLDLIIQKAAAEKKNKISVELSSYIILEVLRALAFAHQLQDSKGRALNIIHRDISPGNILLGYRGEVKLTDFGISTAESRLQKNFTNIPMGKLSYVPPEQIKNEPVTKACDIYGLGVVYYELLTGKHPFTAESTAVLSKKNHQWKNERP